LEGSVLVNQEHALDPPDIEVWRTCELGTLLSGPVNFSLSESWGSLHSLLVGKVAKGII
jgi:hypothetical protein